MDLKILDNPKNVKFIDFVEKYTYRIEWSEEDNVYVGRCLEFPGLSAHGNTSESALKEIKIVVNELEFPRNFIGNWQLNQRKKGYPLTNIFYQEFKIS